MPQNQFKCEECGAIFKSEAEREHHNRTVHSRYTCEDCGQTFRSEAELESHTRVEHPEHQRSIR